MGSSAESHRLQGGPFDGTMVDLRAGGSIIVEVPDSKPPMVARYRWHRGRQAFTFRELDRVVVRVPSVNSHD